MVGVVLEIPGEPMAQPRRVVTAIMVGGKPLVSPLTGRPVLKQYTPTAARTWRATAQAHMRAARGTEGVLEGPVFLIVRAFFSCPRSHYRKTIPRPRAWHAKRPDLDNVVKAVKDAGKGILWVDDAQVAITLAVKYVAAQAAPARVEVRVRPLPDGPDAYVLPWLADRGLASPPEPLDEAP